jgi:hypothetical protein
MTKGAWFQPQRFAGELDFFGPERLAVGFWRCWHGLGLPLPIAVLQMISVGRSALFFGVGNGARHGSGILSVNRADDVSSRRPQNRSEVWSMNQGATLPSMEIPLSSYSAISLFSFQAPASAAGLVADAFHQTAVAHETHRCCG